MRVDHPDEKNKQRDRVSGTSTLPSREDIQGDKLKANNGTPAKKVETLARPTQQVDPLCPLNFAKPPVPIRPRFWFRNSDGLFQEQSGNNKNSLLCSCNTFHSLVFLLSA